MTTELDAVRSTHDAWTDAWIANVGNDPNGNPAVRTFADAAIAALARLIETGGMNTSRYDDILAVYVAGIFVDNVFYMGPPSERTIRLRVVAPHADPFNDGVTVDLDGLVELLKARALTRAASYRAEARRLEACADALDKVLG